MARRLALGSLGGLGLLVLLVALGLVEAGPHLNVGELQVEHACRGAVGVFAVQLENFQSHQRVRVVDIYLTVVRDLLADYELRREVLDHLLALGPSPVARQVCEANAALGDALAEEVTLLALKLCKGRLECVEMGDSLGQQIVLVLEVLVRRR